MPHRLIYRPFWMVWNPNGRAPSFKHASEGSAVAEAERLARQCPGQTFVVLRAIEARLVEDMLRISLAEDADVPF
jgi:hypothetical protein